MQIERLFGIVFFLLDQKRATAAQLADRFGVSVRTIYRDMDTLSLAGIPVYAQKGKNGGISLLEDFVMDKSLLTDREQAELLSVLHGATAVQSGESAELLSKLGGIFHKKSLNWIEIDYSDWSGQQDELFPRLKAAIFQRNIVSFDYYGSTGETHNRRVEPYKLYFKHQAWYLEGFCLKRHAPRMFKLARIKNLAVTGETFPGRDIQALLSSREARAAEKPPAIAMTLRISDKCTFRVYDAFREEQIRRQPDGSYLVDAAFPPGDWVYSFILSFGMYMEVQSPDWLRREIQSRLQQALALYQEI